MKDNHCSLFRNFLLLGTLGCLIEIVFTALGTLRHKNYCLKGSTSLWMFPIYGLGCLIAPLQKCFSRFSWKIRGTFYAFAIYLIELLSGLCLRKINCCPWNYEHSKYNFGAVVRIDYFPCWFLIGLLFEKIILHQNKSLK